MRTHNQSGLALKVPPVALVVIVAGLMWCAARATAGLNFPSAWNVVVAVGLWLVGATICIFGVASFRRAKTTVNPMKVESISALVVSGIYKYTRNPMYLGFLLILLGWAAFLANLTALVLLPVFVMYMNRFQIGPEERMLGLVFAREYPLYCASVRRWV